MGKDSFHPIIREWFDRRFGEPTEPQRRGWPSIAADRDTLIAAPTGSGKTLTAFLVCLDRLWQQALAGQLDDSIHVVYVSPLKALSNDIERNLQTPLAEISELAQSHGMMPPRIRVAVRTGDTQPAERQKMLRHPPHILVTTPESLFILLTSRKSRELLRTVKTVIVDEIHALARDKRGSHLSLTLERLAALCDCKPVRIGLSATQRPIEQIAQFLVGGSSSNHASNGSAGSNQTVVVDVGHIRDLDLGVTVPPTELSAVCSQEQWGDVYRRLCELIASHRSTLVFVNTRRLAERIGHHLRELLGEDAVASHHGSMSRDIRLSAEQRLKSGQLKAIVATSSLEMGIDIGYIDLVCQIGSPRSISALLQRVGRSGHSLGATPCGRLFPLTRDELLECMALVRAVHRRELDRIEIPVAPLDILAQQVVAAVAADDWDEQKLYALCRQAYPYRDLSSEDFEAVLNMVSEGITARNKRGAYVHRDRIHGMLRARRGARLAAVTSGGAIPDTAEYRVVTDPEGTYVGKVDEDFAIESMAGDVFLLGNTSWRVKYVRSGEVLVTDADGAPPSIPFWLGEGLGRTVELSHEVSRLREDIAAWQAAGMPRDEVIRRLQNECGVEEHAAEQASEYIAAQVAALGLVPTRDEIVFERFFDESGGMQLVIHAPLGQRINRAWGLSLRKRFCRSFDFELQAAATDNGVLLSLSPQHSFPIDALFKMLGPHNGKELLEQAVIVQPVFQVRWRWNVTRSLAVLRQQNGQRVPPHMLRFRSDDLLAAAFPETVGCLENHHGDVQIPDHPLVRQTMHDCLHEAMDIDRWLEMLEDARVKRITFIARDTREPSPFCHEILNSNPYTFLDGAPLEERRTRAVATRRTFTAEEVRDLAKLDPEAVAQVRDEAWPDPRDADELHDVLLNVGALLEAEGQPWLGSFQQLIDCGRATRVQGPGELSLWIAAERWPALKALYPEATPDPPVHLPAQLDVPVEPTAALVDVMRGRMSVEGPVTASVLAEKLRLPESQVSASLEAIEGFGEVLRGHFTIGTLSAAGEPEAEKPSAGDPVQWCDRRLLARIHRLTLDGLRRRIKAVVPEDFVRYLARRHKLSAESHWTGAVGLREAIGLLQGFEASAGAWEKHLLPARVAGYDPRWMDELFLSGEVVWGRLSPPRREAEAGPSAASLTRVVPISLLLREDLPWLAAEDRKAPEGLLRANAQSVLGALATRGALFFQELKNAAQLLPAHVDEALRELAACGLITCDGFAAVRAMVSEKKKKSRHGGLPMARAIGSPAGRWTRFPGEHVAPLARDERLKRWCSLLLRRYGVVFRDLLTREASAPSWTELVPIFRRMEMRGEVRGGRFVSGVGGEQFAEERAVEELRETRDAAASDEWLMISAVDPLNLSGIVTGGPRIAAHHRNTLILRGGRCVAARQAGKVEFFETFAAELQADMRRVLITGIRKFASHIRESWLKPTSDATRPRSLLDVPSRRMR